MDQKFKILYILGAGRSGSTLLDIVLGNSGNSFSTGELNRFTKRDGIPHDARDKNVIEFWKNVNDVLKKNKLNNPYSYYDLCRQFEYHSNFFAILTALKSSDFVKYANYQQQLFSAICTTLGKEEVIIIDSSKYPLRAFFLSKIFNSRVSILYLKRQPAAVVESFQKSDVEQPAKGRITSNIYLLMVNVIAETVIKLLRNSNNVSVIYYEQFIDSPVETLKKVERDLQLNFDMSKQIINNNEAFKVGLLFDGNRLRLKQEVRFVSNPKNSKKANHFFNKLFLPLHKAIWYKN